MAWTLWWFVVFPAARRAEAASTILRSNSTTVIPNTQTEIIRYLGQEISAQADWILNLRNRCKNQSVGRNQCIQKVLEKEDGEQELTVFRKIAGEYVVSSATTP